MARIETPRPIRGTQSLRGEEADRFNHVVQTFDRVRKLYGFGRVEMPVFEATAVFARSLGETTDVVSKEMYSFEDRGGDSLTLRPEFTAGIARAFLTEGWQQHAPMKVATHGPLFRYERPQKGRFRQFHQLDAEVIGAAEPAADIELLCMADQLLRELKIDGVTLKLNTLGDAASRDAWRDALVAHFEAHAGELSDDSQRRLSTNPMRILDSKDPRDRPAADSAPAMVLSGEAENFFGKIREGLDAVGVEYEIAPHLVRGLDYYRHTAFEFVTDRLGAQGTVLGGGRYDGLIEALGGPHTPAVGWAAGVERLAMLSTMADQKQPWAIVVEDDAVEAHGLLLARALRSGAGQARELQEKRSAILLFDQGARKRRFERAVAANAAHIVVLDVGMRSAECDLRIRTLESPGQFFWDAVRSVFVTDVVGNENEAREAQISIRR